MNFFIRLLKIAEPNLLREFVLLGILFFQAQVFAQSQPSYISFIPDMTNRLNQDAPQDAYLAMIYEEIWEVELEEELKKEAKLQDFSTQSMIDLQKDVCFGPNKQLQSMDLMIDTLSTRLIFILGLLVTFGAIYSGIWLIESFKSPLTVFSSDLS